MGSMRGEKMRPMSKPVSAFDVTKFIALRDTRALSNEDIGIRLHVSTGAIRHWESGRSKPTPDRLKALADVLDVDVSELLSEAPTETLASYREQAGYSKMAVVRETGITRDRYYQIEHGVRPPTEDEAAALGALLSVEADLVMRSCTDLYQRRLGHTS